MHPGSGFTAFLVCAVVLVMVVAAVMSRWGQ